VRSRWNRLVQKYGALVFGTAWRILGRTADAEDVVQDVFFEAHRLQRKPADDGWGGLLYRMATFRTLDKLRQRKATVPLESVELIGANAGPEDEAIGHELEERLRQALTALSDREAGVFCLKYFEQLSNTEVGVALGISDGAVRVALHKARSKLQALLAELNPGEHHVA
jgi:RNA polymerase sigma-70 factor (ECF subfamily)